MVDVVVETHAKSQTEIELKDMILSTLDAVDRMKTERKNLKEMLTASLINDEDYRLAKSIVEEAKKKLILRKNQVLDTKAGKQLSEKHKDAGTELRELTEALSEYLREYVRISGENEIEDNQGRRLSIHPKYAVSKFQMKLPI